MPANNLHDGATPRDCINHLAPLPPSPDVRLPRSVELRRALRARAGNVVNDLLERFGVHVVRRITQDLEPEFVSIWNRCRPYSMTSPERTYALYQAIRHVNRTHIPGAILECGVWRGGSMMAAALTLVDLRTTDRDLFLFDTY